MFFMRYSMWSVKAFFLCKKKGLALQFAIFYSFSFFLFLNEKTNDNESYKIRFIRLILNVIIYFIQMDTTFQTTQ